MLLFRCPDCRAASAPLNEALNGWRCARCGLACTADGGVLRALPPSRAAYYETFVRERLTILRSAAESSSAARARERNWTLFERKILAPVERAADRPLQIADLGAGRGWLCGRLAERGHSAVAIDILDDPDHGLGAVAQFGPRRRFGAVLAEFDALPFDDAQFDLAVFHASLHYSEDYWRTLREVRRILSWGGQAVILQTPVYRTWLDGEAARERRMTWRQERFGFRGDSVLSMEHLDWRMVERLREDLNIRWRVYKPWPGLGGALRNWRARLPRLPAFPALVASWTAG